MGEIIAPEIFKLQSGGIEAMISTAGAWVEGLRLNTGTETIDLFAPKREFEVGGWKKNRGGMHVCLPNFDPAAESLGLAQHGFGRVLTWEITSIDDASVTMVLDTNKHKLDVPSNYLGLVAEVVYSTEDNKNGLVVLNSKLTMTNNSGANMPWAVGFHPYFASNGDNESNLVVYSRGHEPQEFDKSAIYQAQRLGRASKRTQFGLGGVGVEIISPRMQQLVVWSDNPNEYVCVEPTRQAGILGNPDKDLWPTHKPGAAETYELEIIFNPANAA